MRRSGARRLAVASMTLLAVTLAMACKGGFGRQYEYEEEIYLDTDGSASIIVNSSIVALVALRGVPLDVDPAARVDRDAVRAFYSSPVTRVSRMTRPWRRNGRRFVGVRVEVDDIRRLSEAAPFAWSQYALDVRERQVRYRQTVTGGGAATTGSWQGDEIVAFRLHLPSRVRDHNARSIDDNVPLDLERGNILSWEQRLTDRLKGIPVRIEVEMDAQSILYRTLWLFGLAFAAAMLVLCALIWWVRRGGTVEEDAA